MAKTSRAVSGRWDREPDPTVHLTAERDRLRREVQNLVDSIASGVPADTVAPAIRARELELTRLEAALRVPTPARPNVDALREALVTRAADLKRTLRGDPRVARLLVRRFVEPLTLTDPQDFSGFLEWEATLTPGLLEGLAAIQVVASQSVPSWNQIAGFLEAMRRLRDSAGFAA